MPAPIEDHVWHRCFLGLVPDAAATMQLTRHQAQAIPAQAHRLHPDDLHLTLAFFGRITPAQAQALLTGLPGLAAGSGPVTLAFRQPGLWPESGRPRVQVAEFSGSTTLHELLARTHDLMQQTGLPIETRPFRPHVTLARFAHRLPARPEQPDAWPELNCTFSRLALYTSVNPPQGRRYTILACAELRSAAP